MKRNLVIIDILQSIMLSSVRLVLLYTILLLSPTEYNAAPIDDFVTTWKTDNKFKWWNFGETETGSNKKTIVIPTIGGGYNYDVDWNNDGVFDQIGISGNVSHTYSSKGTYTIRIRGSFPRIYFNNGGDRIKLIAIRQWGSQVWTSMRGAFFGCQKLRVLASDTPDLSSATDLSSMFREAKIMNQSINNWDVSHITNMTGMFRGRNFFNTMAFNKPLNNWNVGSLTTTSHLFYHCKYFNQPLNNWDVRHVTDMNNMFYNCPRFNRPIGTWNTSSTIYMYDMFSYAKRFNQHINSWNTSAVKDMKRMFWKATNFNRPLNNWDTHLVTNMRHMFDKAVSFDQNIGSWDVRNVIDMTEMFKGASLSLANYDALLIGWNSLASPGLKPNINFHGGNSKYCAGAAARQHMINSRHWTIIDAGSTCPNAICQNIIVQLDASANAIAQASNVNNGSNDPDGTITSMSLDLTNFDCSSTGSNQTVSLTVTDNLGASASCNSTVTIQDNISPTINCPNNKTVSVDQGSCTASGVLLGNPIVNDNCSTNIATNNAPATYSVGANNLIWTVTDPSGNSADCNQNITVDIVLDPTVAITSGEDQFICSDSSTDLTWDLGGPGPYSLTYTENGSNPISVSIPAGQTSFTTSVNPTTNTEYQISLFQINNCGTQVNGTILDDSQWINLPSVAPISQSNDSALCYLNNNNVYIDFHETLNGSDRPIVSIFDMPNGIGLGNSIATLRIDPSVQSINGIPYLQRRFGISTDIDENAKVRLYFTQSELDALETAWGQSLLMSDLRVSKYSNDNLSFNGAAELLIPTNSGSIPSGITNSPNILFIELEISSFSHFIIHPKTVGVLPIQLLKFEAKLNKNIVEITWETATEMNNDYFTIERSIDGINWDTINILEGAGTSNTPITYAIQDLNPIFGTSYYRLKQTDYDGGSAYSNIESIYFDINNSNSVLIYPNPAYNKLTIEGNPNELSDYKIYNIYGNDLSNKTLKVKEDSSIIELDVSSLSNGFYIIKTTSTSNKILISR